MICYHVLLKLVFSARLLSQQTACVDPEGGRGGGGGPDALKNPRNIGFHSNTVPDPLIITKLRSLHSMLDHHRHASENGVSLAGR